MTIAERWIADQERAWHDLRADRYQQLSRPSSPLAQVGLHWLDETVRSFPGVPGRWSADDDGVTLQAGPDDGLHRPGSRELITGTEQAVVAEAGSTIIAEYGAVPAAQDSGSADDPAVRIEVIKRTGGYGLRIYDPSAAPLARFRGVPSYPFDPDWIVQAAFLPYVPPQSITVGAAQPGLKHHREAIGEARFDRDGAEHSLIIFGDHGTTIIFSDLTSGIETAPWRILPVTVADDGREVILDFNRTLNMPYAFSDFGTCPRPPEGNHLDIAVTAGELAPDRVDLDHPVHPGAPNGSEPA